MKYLYVLTMLVLNLTLTAAAHADFLPRIHSIEDFPAPKNIDYSFLNDDLTVGISNPNGNYRLTVTGSGDFLFLDPTIQALYLGSNSSYTLVANFDSSNHFVADGSFLSIFGKLPPVASATGTPDGLLYNADLTAFGYDDEQAAIGFRTHWSDPSAWSNQPALTGGSTGEAVYLYDKTGLNTGTGILSHLIEALENNDLASVVGQRYYGLQSIATVPLPLPALLFGSGLLILFGIGKKSSPVLRA